MAKYNGHKNWAYWNVSLWINNDEFLYNWARGLVRQHRNKEKAATQLWEEFQEVGKMRTPDGALYTRANIRAAMVGM